MVNSEVLKKLAQIEEQAGHALAEFPKGLTKERLQMILALARQLRAGLQVQATGTLGNQITPNQNDPQARRP